jgi:hypothetical protein
MVLAGNYWLLQGFDVINAADGEIGIQVSGSHNTLDQVNTYHNGGTGLQISTYRTTDTTQEWPANNLILNCTSYGNGNAVMKSADGFAAKYTVGEDNVFDGCVAYHNAGDGFDVFALVEIGAIEKVLIRNCVSYENGYLESGARAGSGHGFSMGGSNLSGYHTLQNSYAFFNRGAGVTTNSSPDIIVENTTLFNNESYNVAAYTNLAPNTDYSTSGLLSFRTQNMGLKDRVAPKGRQDITKFYNSSSYYWDDTTSRSVNSQLNEVSADWFESLEFDAVTRNADGSINLNGFLELVEARGTGANTNGTASNDITIEADKVLESSSVNSPALPSNAQKDQVEFIKSLHKVELQITQEALRKLLETANNEVLFDISQFEDVTDVEISKEVIEAIVDRKLGLQVSYKLGVVYIPTNTLGSIIQTATGDDLSFQLKVADRSGLNEKQKSTMERLGYGYLLYEISMISNEVYIHEFDETLFVEIPYDGKSPVAAWYLNENGVLLRNASSYDGETKMLTLSLEHLSLYVIGYNYKATTEETNSPDENSQASTTTEPNETEAAETEPTETGPNETGPNETDPTETEPTAQDDPSSELSNTESHNNILWIGLLLLGIMIVIGGVIGGWLHLRAKIEEDE